MGDTLSTLAWLVDAGADEAIGEEPVNRLTVKTPIHPPLEGGLKREAFRGGVNSPLPFSTLPQGEGKKNSSAATSVATDNIGVAQELAAAATTLEELKAALEGFNGCTLKANATNTVFADGTPSHRIMLIGEAPGHEEDRSGKPFVGRAGQLLDKMLASIQLDRKQNAYITNVLNWRPPDNRDPDPTEVAKCLPFLRRHIELVNPQIMILLGKSAVAHVLGLTDGITRLRGTWREYHVAGRLIPVMPTLHPAYLLRQPAHKRFAWRDLQAIETKIKELGLLDSARAD